MLLLKSAEFSPQNKKKQEKKKKDKVIGHS